jgi:hypothetical protein
VIKILSCADFILLQFAAGMFRKNDGTSIFISPQDVFPCEQLRAISRGMMFGLPHSNSTFYVFIYLEVSNANDLWYSSLHSHFPFWSATELIASSSIRCDWRDDGDDHSLGDHDSTVCTHISIFGVCT